ncbi:MAG: beta strand repeat-containing protein [Candidatus Spyradenecus sp.]
MKPTSRSALGFAVARIHRVATTVCHALRRSARPFAALAVLCAVAPLWAKPVYQNGSAALNVNFATTSTTGNNSRLDANTNYGLVPFPGSKWHEMSGPQSNGRVSVTTDSLTDSAENGSATVTINARIFETQNRDAGAILLRDAAIDDYNDGKPESTLTITGIPYACYDVYLYMAGTVYAYNSPVRIKAENGTYSDYYYMPTNKEAALTSTTAQPWGIAESWSATTLGVNVMRIADLTSSSITFATQQLSNARANFAAIQIVERVALPTYEATLAENASVAATDLNVTLNSGGTTKKLSEVTDGESVSIALAGNATISGTVTAKHLQVTGTGTLTFSGAVTVAGNIYAETGANLVLENATTSGATTISGGGTVNLTPTSLGGPVTATTDLILTAPTGATEALPCTITSILTIGAEGRQLGSLTTRGFLKFTNTGSTFYSPLIVENGTLEATCDGQGIKGGLVIKKKCTFKGTSGDSDKLNYSAAVTVDVYGTLDMNGTRWTLGSGNVINVYPGATVKGDGQAFTATGKSGMYGAFDANADRLSMNFKRAANAEDEQGGDITFSSSLRVRVATRVYTLDVAEGVTVNFSGTRSTGQATDNADVGLVAKTGQGKLVLQGDFTLAGASSGPIEVQDTKTLTLSLGSSAVAHRASITGAGSVVLTGANTTLTLPEKTSTAINVQNNATLKIPVTEEELQSGYTATAVTVTAGTVKFVAPDGQEIAATGTGNNELASEIVWTGLGDGTSWSDTRNWRGGNAVPSASSYVAIPLTDNLSLTLPDGGAPVARLRVTGTNADNTLTLSGGALTVSGRILLVGANLTATTGTLPLTNVTAIDLGERTTLDYTVTSAVALPALTGSGTFIKRGTTDMTFKNATTAYLAQVVVAEGTLDTGDGEKSGEFHITVKSNAKFLTQWDTSLTSTASTLCLEGGAILDLRNGNGWRQFKAAITIDATPENPAIIQGSLNGPNSNLQGAITGKGTLEIRKAPDQQDANAFTISGIISDAEDGTLALKVTQTGTEAAVTLTGDNTYTGGTTIADGATVKVSEPGMFGDGEVNIVAGGVVEFYQPGTGSVNHSTENYSKVTGEGTVRFTGSSWRALPSNAANIWASTLAVENNVQGGLVLVDKSNAYKIGTLSGTGCFRADLGDTVAVATLEVTQRADATFSGYFHQEGENGRIPALKVSGDSTKVLTLSFTVPSNKNPSPATLTVEEGASVVLTKAWAGPVTVNGALAIGTAEAPATVTLPQAVTEGSAGQIDLPASSTSRSTLTLNADSTLAGSVTGTGTLALGENVTATVTGLLGDATQPASGVGSANSSHTFTLGSGSTLKLLPSVSTQLAGVISGAGSLEIGDGTAASTVKLTGANTYTGTTTVAVGAKLSLAGDGVLSDAFGEGSAVVVNGTLELAAGSYCRRTMGAGTIRVLNNLTFAIGQAALPAGEQWSDEKTTGLTGFTGTLALVGNLKLTNAASDDYTYAPTGFSVRFEADNQGMIDNYGTSDGQLLCDETGKTSFTLAPGCSLSGEGFILCPITFAASSVIEIKAATAATAETPGVHATSISLTKEEEEKVVKATITLPSEGEHILLKADVASNGFLCFDPEFVLETSVFDFAAGSTLTASTAGVTIFRSSEVWGRTYDTVQVLANPNVPGMDGDVAVAVAVAVRDQAVNEFGLPVTVTTVTADTETTPKADVKGALFFENVVKTEQKYSAETGITYTAKVTYDFGVSAITVKRLTLKGTEQLCVVVCAKVESSAITGTKATFKESARVQLYLNDKLCDGGTDGKGPLATALTSAIDNSVDDSDKSVRWFAVPLSSLPATGTSNFTVKVTEAATP